MVILKNYYLNKLSVILMFPIKVCFQEVQEVNGSAAEKVDDSIITPTSTAEDVLFEAESVEVFLIDLT